MRKVMIFASVMLALFQLWPMEFSHRADSAASAATAAPPAFVAVESMATVPHMAQVSASAPAPKSCYRQYRVKFDACSANDQICHVKAADQWDLCEATGLWPD